MPTENDKRIARNTFYLYGRMLLTIFISLYISRVVLEVLGVDDYGIYTVVGGIAIGFGFLNSAMAGATSRFLSYEIGSGNEDKLRATFIAAVKVHIALAVVIGIIADTAGLWYVFNELEVGPERRMVAVWTYQFAILGLMVQIVQTPFYALIIARERMGYFAFVSLLNVLVKLAVVLLLKYAVTVDSLIYYSAMMFGAILLMGIMYTVYCFRNFQECRIRGKVSRDVVRQMVSYSSWNIYSNMCVASRVQGLQLILNKLGGIAVNAASGLTTTVSTTLYSFAVNVITAFRPQIIKQYAGGDIGYMNRLLENCAKYSLLLLGLIVVPMVVCMDTILGIWLKEVPEFTAVFCRLAIIAVCGEVVNEIVSIGIQSTGKVARLSVVSGTMYLIELALMWLLLYLTRIPAIVYAVHLVLIFLIAFIDSIILKSQIRDYRLMSFWMKGVALPSGILVLAFVMVWCVSAHWRNSFFGVLGIGCISTAIIIAMGWFFAIDSETRSLIRNKLLSKIKRV